MKTYEEMAASALARIEKKQTARRHRFISLAGTGATGLCLVAFLAISLDSNSPQLTADPSDITDSGYVHTQTLPTEAITETDDTSQPAEADTLHESLIVINEIPEGAEVTARAKQLYYLLWEDFVPFERMEDGIEGYYGIDLFPEVPDDLISWETAEAAAPLGIYRRKNGEVYHDGIVLNWSDDSFSRSVNMEIAKGQMPFTCVARDNNYRESVILGADVYIAHSDSGYYTAEMMYEGVGIVFSFKGLSIGELVEVIASVIRQ